MSHFDLERFHRRIKPLAVSIGLAAVTGATLPASAQEAGPRGSAAAMLERNFFAICLLFYLYYFE